jgi:hypothetical protein
MVRLVKSVATAQTERAVVVAARPVKLPCEKQSDIQLNSVSDTAIIRDLRDPPDHGMGVEKMESRPNKPTQPTLPGV